MQSTIKRFSGVANLYGSEILTKFRQSHVCIVGVGGVGSWAVEALARSGIGCLQLIDLDHITETNINRQLQALTPNIGKSKVVILAERIAHINPDIQVIPIEKYLERSNIQELIDGTIKWDWVIDCIDQIHNKAALLAYCRQQQINIVSVGGAGGRYDPSRISIADLSRTAHDPLLSKLRSILRQNYGFPRDPKKSFQIPCVYSTEAITADTMLKSDFQCSGYGTYGTVVTVTATYGLMAASLVLNQLARE